MPPRTIVAQHVVVLVDISIKEEERAAAQELVRFPTIENRHKVFNQYNLRPPEIGSTAFPTIDNPFTATDLNGWSQAYHELVNGLWKLEIEPNLDVISMPKLAHTME